MFTDYNQFQGSSKSLENVAVLSLIADTSTSDKVDNDLIPSVKLNDETASTASADRVPILLQSKDASNSERVLSQTPTSITDGTALSNSERVLSQTPISITDGTALSNSERVLSQTPTSITDGTALSSSEQVPSPTPITVADYNETALNKNELPFGQLETVQYLASPCFKRERPLSENDSSYMLPLETSTNHLIPTQDTHTLEVQNLNPPQLEEDAANNQQIKADGSCKEKTNFLVSCLCMF